MKKLLTISWMVLLTPIALFAQNSAYSDIILSAQGRPIAGANVSVCNTPGLATTAASVTSNIAVLTFGSSPITAGFVAGMTLQVSAFTGGDTYLNGGTLSGGVITGGFTILSVTSTTVSYALVHANASATSNGNAFQQGNSVNSCAPLASITSDSAGLNAITQPGLTTDGLGNYAFFAAGNSYIVQFSGTGITLKLKPVNLSCSGSANCSYSGTVTFTGAVNCTIVNAVACVSNTNPQGWAGANAGAWINSAMAANKRVQVATGTTGFATQIEMVSGAELEFACDTFTNVGVSGGIFVHFASSVSNAVVKGQGIGCTYVRNNSTGTQFGAVVQDEGTDNTVSDMTLDGNSNTTSTLISQITTREHVRNLKLIHDLTHNSGRNYAWHQRGGTDLEASNVITIGGSFDGIFQDASIAWGSITRGTFTNIWTSLSPCNGMDTGGNGGGNSVSGVIYTNIHSFSNGGTSGDTCGDGNDQYGINVVGNGPITVRNNVYSNLFLSGNGGAGLRIAGSGGTVTKNVFYNVNSDNNGVNTVGTPAALRTNGCDFRGDTGTLSFNYIQGLCRKGSATNALFWDANTTNNTYLLDIGADPLSKGSDNDWYVLNTNSTGQPFMGGLRLDQQAFAACLAAPSIANVSGVGVCINSATTRFPGATGVEIGGTLRNVGSTAIMGLTPKTGSGGGNYTGTNTTYTVAGAVLDSTNLCLVVTIPTGWKLSVSASGSMESVTAAVAVNVSLADLGTTCSTTGAAALAGSERSFTPPAAGTFDVGFQTQAVITGNGAAHAIALQALTSNAADAWGIQNTSAAIAPGMTFVLMPSN